jgi:membrane associated rhomboid family serine protease
MLIVVLMFNTSTTLVNQVIINSVALIVIGKFLEPIWGSKEYFKFIMLINVLSATTWFFMLLGMYMSTGNERLLYFPWGGTSGMVTALLVALKQLLPDYELFSAITSSPSSSSSLSSSTASVLGQIRVKHLPFIVISSSLVIAMFQKPSFLPFVMFGFLYAWVYLRYYQRNSGSAVVGDLNDSFAFVTFYPEFMQYVSRLDLQYYDGLTDSMTH